MKQDVYSPHTTTSETYSLDMTTLSYQMRSLFPNMTTKFISSKSSACMFFGQFTFLRWFKCITCSSLNDDKMTIETRKNIISIITCTLQCCLFKDVGNGIKYFIHSFHELMHSTNAPKMLIVAYSFLFSPCCCHFVAVLLAPNDDTVLP